MSGVVSKSEIRAPPTSNPMVGIPNAAPVTATAKPVEIDATPIATVTEMPATPTATVGPASEAVRQSPDARNVDVRLDGELFLMSVPYLGSSDYLTVPGGTYRARITPGDSAGVAVVRRRTAAEQTKIIRNPA